jgi:hypothetical protein
MFFLDGFDLKRRAEKIHEQKVNREKNKDKEEKLEEGSIKKSVTTQEQHNE